MLNNPSKTTAKRSFCFIFDCRVTKYSSNFYLQDKDTMAFWQKGVEKIIKATFSMSFLSLESEFNAYSGRLRPKEAPFSDW